jgi:hypothetical protein
MRAGAGDGVGDRHGDAAPAVGGHDEGGLERADARGYYTPYIRIYPVCTPFGLSLTVPGLCVCSSGSRLFATASTGWCACMYMHSRML